MSEPQAPFFRAATAIGQYILITDDTSADRTAKISDASSEAIGITTQAVAAGEAITAEFRAGYIARAISGEALALGTRVKSDASGKCVEAGSAGDFSIGKVVEVAATDADQRVYILIQPTRIHS